MTKLKIQTGKVCKLYPKGRERKIRVSGFAGTKKAAVCISPDACPPDSEFPKYDQVIKVRKKTPGKPIGSSCEVYERFKNLRYAAGERFYAIGVDNRNRPIVTHKAAQGGTAEVEVDLRILFAPLIAAGAARFFVIHNHPSGNPLQSPEDVGFTRRLENAGALLGMALLDHVIIGDEGYISLRDAGYIQ